jgi:glucokinase
MKYSDDKRIVMTLDAGGTTFVFSAVQGNEEIVAPITLPSQPRDLELCLGAIVEGFEKVKSALNAAPSAISFAFPGPADYPNGIIGDLPNLPAFRGGVALGPMLREKFGIPVFINNDGDLFVYGEAIAGLLPYVNTQLEKAGSQKRFKNLFGITLGTGCGAGIVVNGELFIGDNSNGGEIWLTRNKLNGKINVEDGASIRAVQRVYAEECGVKDDALTPKDIYEIAIGKKEGYRKAAVEAFRRMSEVVGDAISNAITLIDALVVIGGGVAGANSLFMPFIIDEMNGSYIRTDGSQFRRLVQKVYNLEDEKDLKEFLKSDSKEINIPGTSKKIIFEADKKTGVGMSKLGTSKAVSIGAYAFALNSLDNKNNN